MIFLNRTTNKQSTLLTQEKRTFCNPIQRVETTAYALFITDRIYTELSDYRIINSFIERGEPANFVPPKTKKTTLHKVHDPKFETSPYKHLLTPHYLPHSTYNINKEEYDFKLRMYQILVAAVDMANVNVILYLKAYYFDKLGGKLGITIDPYFRPNEMAYDLLDLAIKNWVNINLYVYQKKIDTTKMHMLEYYYDTIVAVLELGNKNEDALKHFAHYFKETEDYAMMELFIKRYDFNICRLLYYCVIWDYLNVFNDLINNYKYWIDFGGLLDAMNESNSYGNVYIRKIVCDKLINMGPYFYIPIVSKYPEFHYHRLFFCGLREYSMKHGIENVSKHTYILTEEARDYVAEYIKNHTDITLDQIIDPPLIGFTCPNNHYTSSMALYKNKRLNNKIELRHIEDFEYY
jgi:hypothetical protein